jgi:hypothetical protein
VSEIHASLPKVRNDGKNLVIGSMSSSQLNTPGNARNSISLLLVLGQIKSCLFSIHKHEFNQFSMLEFWIEKHITSKINGLRKMAFYDITLNVGQKLANMSSILY